MMKVPDRCLLEAPIRVSVHMHRGASLIHLFFHFLWYLPLISSATHTSKTWMRYTLIAVSPACCPATYYITRGLFTAVVQLHRRWSSNIDDKLLPLPRLNMDLNTFKAKTLMLAWLIYEQTSRNTWSVLTYYAKKGHMSSMRYALLWQKFNALSPFTCMTVYAYMHYWHASHTVIALPMNYG